MKTKDLIQIVISIRFYDDAPHWGYRKLGIGRYVLDLGRYALILEKYYE